MSNIHIWRKKGSSFCDHTHSQASKGKSIEQPNIYEKYNEDKVSDTTQNSSSIEESHDL